MEKIKILLVDDEVSAHNILSSLIKHLSNDFEVAGTATDLPEAVKLIQQLKPDVVFLDIEMPEYAGYEIVQFFEEINFEIVFVTAYNKYAVKAFELAALDYLVKPVQIERLQNTLERISNKLTHKINKEQIEILNSSLKNEKVDQIVIIDKGNKQILNHADIIAIEAQRSYCNIHTLSDRRFCVSKNLKHFESLLEDSSNFFRVHKSWIVNLNHLESYNKSNYKLFLKESIEAKISKYRISDFELAIKSRTYS